MKDRLDKQLRFIYETDKLKNILRRTLVADGSRRENDAEHSWHIALMAMVLLEYAEDGVDPLRVMKMAIVHDLVEIYAGDTFAYDVHGYESKAARENDAAQRLFGMLPGDQETEIRDLWDEFERMETPAARYASAIDRLQPFISNYLTDGHTWRTGNVTTAMVYKRMDIVKHTAPGLWDYVEDVIRDAVAKGYLKD